MPLATLHLISLAQNRTLREILSAIKSSPSPFQPIILSKPVRWIIVPELIDTEALLSPSKPWDLLYIHTGTDSLPSTIKEHTHDHYSLQIGIPSRLLKDFQSTNYSLLHPLASSVPGLDGSIDNSNFSRSSQDLSLSRELYDWISSFQSTGTGQSAVSMLNLLSFKEGMKGNYIQYGQEFARSIGSKHGGNAKLVGHVVTPSSTLTFNSTESASSDTTTTTAAAQIDVEKKQQQQHGASSDGASWEEFALAHYPSITHFASMLASTDYQAVNQRFRVPSLKDTCILFTSEIEIEQILNNNNDSSRTDRHSNLGSKL